MTPERTKEEILRKHFDPLNHGHWNPPTPQMREAIYRAMEEYKSQCSPVESKWVSVNERLPERGGEFLVIVDGRVHQCYWFDGWFYKSVDKRLNATYWHRLPELPSPTIEETKEK